MLVLLSKATGIVAPIAAAFAVTGPRRPLTKLKPTRGRCSRRDMGCWVSLVDVSVEQLRVGLSSALSACILGHSEAVCLCEETSDRWSKHKAHLLFWVLRCTSVVYHLSRVCL